MTESRSDFDVLSALRQIRASMTAACLRSGRSEQDVSLMAVTKTVSPEQVNRVLGAGVRLIGENRVQEYLTKKDAYQKPYSFHFIGHLQTNKIRQIISEVDCIESLDSCRLLRAVSEEAEKHSRVIDCFLEWNVGNESAKTGAGEDELRAMLKESASLAGVRVTGLMCVPPAFATPEESRPYFRKTKALFDALKQTEEGGDLQQLSMGMSHDYPVAIEEGATIVRVGSALFGARIYQ